MEELCYTREVALEKAIEMEMKSFQIYKVAYREARDPVAKDLLRDLALDELRHKHTLEKALFDETFELHEPGFRQDFIIKLNRILEEKPLGEDATEQEVLDYAIRDKSHSLDFYRRMAEQCNGAPMEKIFHHLSEDEEGHLARLKKLYKNLYEE